MNYEIIQANKDDLLKIAACHRKAFPTALASKMGDAFLVKMFDWYLSTQHTFLFFIESSHVVAGYCGGMIVDGTLAHGSSSSMTQHTFNEAIKALALRPWLLLHRDFLSRYGFFARNIVTRMRNRFTSKEVRSATKPSEPNTGLVIIGVAPSFQGKGFGSALLQEFENRTLQRGFKRMTLTVKTDNSQAIKSYRRNGWHIVSTKANSTFMEKRLRP